MELLASGILVLGGVILVAAFSLVLFLPAWWLALRVVRPAANPFFRGLVAAGLALVAYLTFVNLAGRLLHLSLIPVWTWLVANLVAGAWLWRFRRGEVSLAPLRRTWRTWIGPVALAVVLGLPQWLVAVSTNYWDETASSAIHLTAPNQFAEGVFPPRHNALPDIAIKYHYGFTILSGTVRWLTGWTANVSIDAVSTALWLFVFLFIYFWLRQLTLGRGAALWGGFTALLGGGFGWLYLRRLEAYDGIEKTPALSALVHRFDESTSWLVNLRQMGRVPAAHLRNADGSLSALPWDILAQFQQHAVALGIALALVALFLFVTWRTRRGGGAGGEGGGEGGLQIPLLLANVAVLSVLFLAHAVFGGVAAVTAGLVLLGAWLRRPTRDGFLEGLAFAGCLAGVALLHGGLLARGVEYGASANVLTLRNGFGYHAGGVSGFLHWNLAGFGLPLLLAVVAWALHPIRRERAATERNLLFLVLSVFTVFAYLVPQLTFYSSETIGVEQFTEISKFFFAAHLGLALLSAFGVAYAVRHAPAAALAPALAAMAIVPLAFVRAHAFRADGSWLGFYRAPYGQGSIEMQMGRALHRFKHGTRDTYFDASADERRHGYLSEMLVFGGSVFTLTPSRYERTGIGYRLAESVVAQRLRQNSRMARLWPGAAEDCRCGWYYTRPAEDRALAPLMVRARFEKAVAEGYLLKRFEAGPRALYEIVPPTTGLDEGIERYWRPRVVSQVGAGSVLAFYDYAGGRILAGGGGEAFALPALAREELVQPYTVRNRGGTGPAFVLGRLKDTDFRLGARIEDLVERSPWGWSRLDARTGTWEPEYEQWLWDWDLPLIADLGDGAAVPVAYRVRTRTWLAEGNRTLNGPAMEQGEQPVPFGGRFLEGSAADLGLWSQRSGRVLLQSVATGRSVTMQFGMEQGNVLVPGDYDGDGYDEMALWQRSTATWMWRRAPDGPVSQAQFGTATSVPLPFDYNGDGRLDLAYWEPAEGRIYVSYTRGRSVDLVVPVPPRSMPAFVNLY